MNLPFLRFDFPDSATICFASPLREIRAQTLADVRPALAAVEAAAAEGMYVAGFISYEAAPAFDAALRVRAGGVLPLLWFGVFDAPVPLPPPESGNAAFTSAWAASVAEAAYGEAIRDIRAAIAAGETYQINYTMRLRAGWNGSASALYDRLRRAQGRGYHAYMDLGRLCIVSASPELFFQRAEDRITVRPMKGTAARSPSAQDDLTRIATLACSPKDRAENVMIVDMMRSDLGRVAVPATVNVDSLFDVETYPTVHQLTSTISARLRPDTGLWNVFAALFPSASVTGAPKVNTMRWIADLETEPRGVYCGAIGYVRPGGACIFNVPIRTVLLDREAETAEYGVGGGITWDSTREGEYAEAWLKARVLTTDMPEFELLETLLLDEGAFYLLARHLARLAASARYFGFVDGLDAARDTLGAYAADHPVGRNRVRLTVSRDGIVNVTGAPLAAPSSSRLFALAGSPVASVYPFLYHKTTNRAHYQVRRAGHEDVYDMLLWNERGEITEFTTGNVVVEWDGELYTPPLAAGLLAGVLRAQLLEEGKITERALRVEDLQAVSRVWFINSVRGWVELFPAEPGAGA